MFENLKKNLAQEKKILADMKSVYSKMNVDVVHKTIYLSSLNALLKQIYFLNRAVPELLKEWTPISQTEEDNKQKELNQVENYSYTLPSTNVHSLITINKGDRRDFLKKLKLSEEGLQNISQDEQKEVIEGELKPNEFIKFSNKFFRKTSENIVPQFSDIAMDLKKGNVPVILSSYISMAIFSATIGFILGFLIYVVLLIFNLTANWTYFWIPFAAAGLVLTAFYLYPASEASSVQKKIAYELPFVAIHMASIAGSNIEPTKIFKIIANSKEYPCVGAEMKKVIAQTDLYGYDLVASLKNVAIRTSNKALAELFSGLATNISTGGDLKNFLEKKADNYLLDYKLEREKYADLAGTFMDVYISILIAAPLVLMMMFIVMNVANMGIGIGISTLMTISIFGIAVVNVIFIVVLNMKQPKV